MCVGVHHAGIFARISVHLFKHFIEKWKPEVPFGAVDAGVGAMLGFVDTGGVDAEKRIRQPAVTEGSRVREEEAN